MIVKDKSPNPPAVLLFREGLLQCSSVRYLTLFRETGILFVEVHLHQVNVSAVPGRAK